jgi:hypothetical protein
MQAMIALGICFLQYVPRGLLVEDLPLMPWMTARAFHSQANFNKD